MKRGIWIALALVLATLLAGFVVLPLAATQLVEQLGTDATDTAVRVGSIDFDWRARRATLREITIANPRGFVDEPALALGAITVELDDDTLGREPIVFRRMRVADPVANVIVREDGDTNLARLRANLRASVAAGRRGPPPAEPGDVVAEIASRTRIRVAELSIGSGEAHIAAPELGVEEPVAVPLGAVRERDIGGTQGATPREMTRSIALAIVESTVASVAASAVPERLGRQGITGALRNALDDLVDAGREALEDLAR